MAHKEFLRNLWKTQVPPVGQADTVQGELLRCVAKLEDEARRNGNVNYDRGHARMARFVERVLLDPAVFTPEDLMVLHDYLRRIRKRHLLSPEAYDRLNDAVAEWCFVHPEPREHVHDPKLRR